jgi:hypothetical protein
MNLHPAIILKYEIAKAMANSFRAQHLLLQTGLSDIKTRRKRE